MTAPLSAIRVVDLTRLLPGAYATRLLADLGAEVVKIEDPAGGDGMRSLGARWFGPLSHGKRSVTLDLRSPDAAAVLDALLERSDVVVDSFRPATARRLGVDPGTLRAKRPRLICASMIGFARDGAGVGAAAHDINYQSLAGLLRPPRLPGPLVGDIGAAMQAAIAILAALVERQRTGLGAALDVTIEGAARAWAMFPDTEDFASACYSLYETADGEWLAVGALEPKFWRAFCEAIGRPDFIALQHSRSFDEVRAVMRTRTRDEWLERFRGVDTCVTPVVARPSADASRSADSSRAPALGADTDAVLDAAGIGAAERDALRRRHVI